MDDDMIDRTEPGYIELARRLEAYADLRLSPGTAATTRMRTAVMTAAHRRAALIHADATFDAAGATTSARAATGKVGGRPSWRRPAAALFAGALTLFILVGTAYGARPGGPLYAARLWTEMANLPADLVDRAEAEVNRLEERLQEAQQASSSGDVPGTQAALVAYSRIVVEAADGSDGDPTASAALEVTVTRHVVVLTLMVDSVPSQARQAAEQALTSSTMALDDLDKAGKHTSKLDRSPHAADVDAIATTAQAARKGPAVPSCGAPADPPSSAPADQGIGAPAAIPTATTLKHAGAAHVQHRPHPPKPPKGKDPVKPAGHAGPGPHGRDADRASP